MDREGHRVVGARPRTLGHGGVLGLVLAIPVAAMSLIGMGRALGPHPAPRTIPVTATAATPAQASADQCFRTPPDGAPAQLARGYRYLWYWSGSYGDHAHETTWVYNRSCADPDANWPVLVIRITDAGGPASPARLHQGRLVDLNSAHGTAVYYQRWLPPVLHTVLCSGGYWFPDQKVSCRWDANAVNLLLVDARQDTYAILGCRTNGIGRDELVAIARRLPGAQSTG